MASKLVTVKASVLAHDDEIDGLGTVDTMSKTPKNYLVVHFTDGTTRIYHPDQEVNIWVPPPGDWDYFEMPIAIMTECGKRADDYDQPGTLTVNGHYHYLNGYCNNEPPYEMGGPT